MMRIWRALLAAAVLFTLSVAATSAQSWSTWHTAAIAQRDGRPVFLVDGKPFFVYGAAFFYERTPRSQWRDDLLAYKRAGINTIDVYVIWNWHQPQPGPIDFTGATNPRRDLRGLFALIHELGLKAIVRPGPVIRNEWRNGGYPDWLLRRPEYTMPLHDILEGRYPATATYQNAHADAAAAEWLSNATHLRESTQWLDAVLHEIEPYSHDVLAIALDDDQGAYIDNDTWPAPHWHQYIGWLRSTVARVTGPRVPLFINTYQMKVTASAPVWAWGNWYQSDADVIGDHDLAQLAFSTALLQTQSRMPVMASEFQAGWLQGAADVAPRASAPQNTTIALHEMLQLGVRGVVNFPLADTLNPSGWEAPWTNWFYAWNAAFTLQNTQSARGAAVAAFGSLLREHGAQIAAMQPVSDIAIAWLPSAYDSALMPNDRIGRLADLTIAALQRCRALARTCRAVDLRFGSTHDLTRTRYLVLPQTGFPMRFLPTIERRLALVRRSVRIVPSVDAAVAAGASSATAGIADSALLAGAHGNTALFDVFNANASLRRIPATALRIGTHRLTIPAMTVAPYDAADVWIDARGTHVFSAPEATMAARDAMAADAVPITNDAWTAAVPHWYTVRAHDAVAYNLDVYDDGEGAIVLDNGIVRVAVDPNAGARAFLFEDLQTHRNLFTPIGAARDDVATPPSPSPRDYIAAYTHPIEPGTFNRPYACTIANGEDASVRCVYDAPDFGNGTVHFEKTFVLKPDDATLALTVRASRDAVSLSAIAPAGITVTWPSDNAGTETAAPGYRLLRLTYAAGRDETIRFSRQGPLPHSSNRP